MSELSEGLAKAQKMLQFLQHYGAGDRLIREQQEKIAELEKRDGLIKLIDGDVIYKNVGTKEEPVWERIGAMDASRRGYAAFLRAAMAMKAHDDAERAGLRIASVATGRFGVDIYLKPNVIRKTCMRSALTLPPDLTVEQLADVIEWEGRHKERAAAIDELAKTCPGAACMQSPFVEWDPCPVDMHWALDWEGV